MLFRLSRPPLTFEFPEEWWIEAGAANFIPSNQSYLSNKDIRDTEVILALKEIAPAFRVPSANLDTNGFRRQGGTDGGPGGMVDVLQAMINGVALPPVKVRRIRGTSSEGFGYILIEGFHRFYASYALRFSKIPCLIEPDSQTDAHSETRGES